MTVLALSCVLIGLYFAVELIKLKWLRHSAHIALLFGGLIWAFRCGFNTGDVTARGEVSREVQDVIAIVSESSTTNTVNEIQVKLGIMRREMPKVIMQNDRLPLLRALKVINK
jgi:hypothetical protein